VSADQLKADYQNLADKSIPEVEKRLLIKRCQIVRIGALLDRTIEGLQKWSEAELKYWDSWGEAEQKRVDGETSKLEMWGNEQRRREEVMEDEKKDIEELQRRLDDLERTPSQTQTIQDQIAALIQRLDGTKTALEQTAAEYDQITVQIKVSSDSIYKQLVEIRENRRDVAAYTGRLNASYDKMRVSAQQVCDASDPKKSQAAKQ
jgi:chromosome segregation ATPase